LAAALVAIASARCAATMPDPLPRNPAGPCLQLRVRRGKPGQQTLWRGDVVVAQDPGGDLEAGLIDATADNPAAAAEARASVRAKSVTSAIEISGLIAIVGLGAIAAWKPDSRRLGWAVGLGGMAVIAGTFGGAAFFDSRVTEVHLKNALDIYNANPPPGCGAPAPEVSRQRSP
jgi:hypothetical protein